MKKWIKKYSAGFMFLVMGFWTFPVLGAPGQVPAVLGGGAPNIPAGMNQANSPNATSTPTAMFASIFPFTPTYTSSQASTSTPTATGTLSPSSTFTSTFTLTFSPTPTQTPTVTSTPTNTTTGTQTPTETFTPTSTFTFTSSPTFTSTPTWTPTRTSTPGVFKFSVSPKPDAQGVINFSWGTTIPADEAFLKIYTSGFRVVREFYFNRDENSDYLSAGTHDFIWDGKDDNKRALPPAIYLCFIDVNVGKKKYEASGKTEIP